MRQIRCAGHQCKGKDIELVINLPSPKQKQELGTQHGPLDTPEVGAGA